MESNGTLKSQIMIGENNHTLNVDRDSSEKGKYPSFSTTSMENTPISYDFEKYKDYIVDKNEQTLPFSDIMINNNGLKNSTYVQVPLIPVNPGKRFLSIYYLIYEWKREVSLNQNQIRISYHLMISNKRKFLLIIHH